MHHESRRNASTPVPGTFESPVASLRALLLKPTHVVSQIGYQDRDILPHWLAHYRRLGVADFHLVLHGTWSECRVLADLCTGADVSIADEVDEAWDDKNAVARFNRILRDFHGDWVLQADADEFIELPMPTLAGTQRAMIAFGMSTLPSIMVQRIAADGAMAPLGPDDDLQAVFPLGSPLLVEQMGGEIPPPWKSKYHLFLVGADSTVRRANHLPQHASVTGFGLRSVTHHFKWRANILALMAARAETDPGSAKEKRVMVDWLAANGEKLPLGGAFPVDREALHRRGLLRRPSRSEIAMGVLLHRVRLRQEGRRGLSETHLTQRLQHFDSAWGGDAAMGLPARATALATRPGRIALVTFSLGPPEGTSGIATWVGAAADSLTRAGNEVTIFYVAHANPPFHPVDRETWAARGYEVVVVEPGPGHADPVDAIRNRLVRLLADGRFDIAHFPDCWGLGAQVAAARRQGHLERLRVVVTAHGPMDWHGRGNREQRSVFEVRNAHKERIQSASADFLLAPSRYIADWYGSAGFRTPAATFVHANPVPHAVWAGRAGTPASAAPIRRMVFFGRLEIRKGLELFCDALDRLHPELLADREIVFAGRRPGQDVAAYLRLRAAAWPAPIRIVSNWMSHDALLLLGEPGTLAVIPSIVDNAPYSVIECLANGTPIVSTRVGGIPELVHPDDHDVLVEPDPRSLADALERALTDGCSAARPAFDFATAELQWLAWHGEIMREIDHAVARRSPARIGDAAATVVFLGEPAPWCRARLDDQGGALVRPLVAGSNEPAAAANALALATRDEFLVFCGPSVVAESGAVAALVRAATNSGADAVIASYAEGSGSAPVSPASVGGIVHPAAGPLSLAAVENVFGGRFFLVRRAAFEALSGFRTLPELAGTEHRDLLNRLLLSGGRIVSVPFPLYVEYQGHADSSRWLATRRALIEPFLAGAPGWLADLVNLSQDSGWLDNTKPIDDVAWAIANAERREKQGLLVSGFRLCLMTGAQLGAAACWGDGVGTVTGDDLEIVADGPDPILLMPAVAASPRPLRLTLRVDLTIPRATVAVLFWMGKGDADYREARTDRIEVPGGRQTVVLSTEMLQAPASLRFDPGAIPGRYVIHGIEIRASHAGSSSTPTAEGSREAH